MKTIRKQYHIYASKEAVWDALVNPKTIEKWGGGPVKMSAKSGAKFSLWGGDIWGKNTKVTSKAELVQDWYGGDWDAPSIATFKLTHRAGCTALYLTHKNIPEDAESFNKGWDDYYLGAIKHLLEKN